MKTQTIKIWNETRKALKVLAALCDCSMIQALDDITRKALEYETQKSQDTIRPK